MWGFILSFNKVPCAANTPPGIYDAAIYFEPESYQDIMGIIVAALNTCRYRYLIIGEEIFRKPCEKLN